MVKSYRAIQQWNHWLTSHLGLEILASENKLLSELLANCYAKHAVLIGVPKQYLLLNHLSLARHWLITPLVLHEHHLPSIEGDWNEIPILSGSADTVILPHSLEFVDNPHQVLSEACRIVKPEGSLIIFGFNPYSLWSLRALYDKWRKNPTWMEKSNFLSINKIKEWLSLADFELLKQKTILYRPPVNNERLLQKLKMMDWIGEISHLPFGSIYMLMAKAKVIPLTPIRLRWKQELSGIKLTIPGSY